MPIDEFHRIVAAGIAAHNAKLGRRTETAQGRSFDQVFAESYATSPIGKATPEQLRLALLTAEDRVSDKRTGVLTLEGTPWMTGVYAGDKEGVARRVYRYKQTIDTQTERTAGLAIEPGYFETPTALRIRGLLTIAQMGRITVCATGPGTGKTMAMREYKASAANVWDATMRPTTKSVAAMIQKVLIAVGGNARIGWTRQMSDQVVDRIAGRRGLLVIDEANHLDLEALEEIRAWHDATGVGVCLLGNEELIMRIRGGPRRDAFARLNSRIAQSHEQNLPVDGDVEAFCDAWQLQDPQMRALLKRIALTPGAGGLRECRQIVEQASIIAVDEERPLSFGDLRDAQATRATKHIRIEGLANA